MALNQQQLEKTGIYQAKSSLPTIAAELEQIATIAEAEAAQKTNRAKTGGWIMLGGLIGAIIGGAADVNLLLVVSVLAMVVGLGWLIYAFVGAGKLVAHRVRLDVARQRVAMIEQDAGPKTEFAIRLAMSSNPTRLSGEPWHGRKGGNQQLFEESWLTLEGRLLDGTLLSDEIKDLKRERTFSNARGKRKTKTRLQYLVNVRFYYPQELYGDARPVQKALNSEVKVSRSATLRGLRVTEKAVVMKAVVTAEKDIIETAGMLSVGAYRILNLARRITAAQRGKIQ
jgi:hypothetical protein